MIAKLLDLTVFASFNETTSLKAFILCRRRLVLLWPTYEETECNADIS